MPTPFKVLLSEKQISEKIQVLAHQIENYCQNARVSKLIVLGILKGSFIFLSDLVRRLSIPMHIDFIEASSYGAGTTSSGQVKILRDTSLDLKGASVLLVEDIVDTGLTIRHIVNHLQGRGAREIKVCALLDKPSRRQVEVQVDFLGFAIEDHFVVGYGLDFNNRFREFPAVVIYDSTLDSERTL